MARQKESRGGKVLCLVGDRGRWLAAVQMLTTSATQHPVLSELVPVEELKGTQRRKVSRWLQYMGASPLA